MNDWNIIQWLAYLLFVLLSCHVLGHFVVTSWKNLFKKTTSIYFFIPAIVFSAIGLFLIINAWWIFTA